MKKLMMSLLLLTACEKAAPIEEPAAPPTATPPAAPEAPAAAEAADAAAPSEAATDGPSKASLAYYCSAMAAITPDQFKDVAPAEIQARIAKRLADGAAANNISDWAAFEQWMQATAPDQRQTALEALIQQHGLQETCVAVRDPAVLTEEENHALSEMREAAEAKAGAPAE